MTKMDGAAHELNGLDKSSSIAAEPPAQTITRVDLAEAVYQSDVPGRTHPGSLGGGPTNYRGRVRILLSRRWLLFADRKSTRLNSSHSGEARMPSSA